ncbi:MAG: aspartate--tRNA(Asn) ligase [Candidatus Hydrothermarchaeales archaeon]
MKRRYSGNITPQMDGESVKIAGWVHDIRDLGKLRFILIRDREGIIQITLPKKEVSTDVFSKSEELGREWVVEIEGVVKAMDKAPNGYEILPQKIEILNSSDSPLPLDPTGKVPADLDTRLDNRIMDLRRHENLDILKLRSVVLTSVRDFFLKNDFVEVNTPKLVASATKGGTELFPISYFEREAFLGQSPQLYKQMLMASGLDRIFEIAQIFRAEEHNTRKHLNEAVSIDAEAAFCNEEDVMKILENLIHSTYSKIIEKHGKEIGSLKNIKVPTCPFERISYSDAIDELQSHDLGIQWGEDFPTIAEKKLGERHSNFYFVTDWPTDIKPFYTMPREEEDICAAFDLMYRDVELASGTKRIHDYKLLKERIEAKGLNPQNFTFYLDVFKYGMPPHAGWGLGLDRLMMVITGVKNIREVVIFPRDRKRLTP